jgi:hypothetical protein
MMKAMPADERAQCIYDVRELDCVLEVETVPDMDADVVALPVSDAVTGDEGD